MYSITYSFGKESRARSFPTYEKTEKAIDNLRAYSSRCGRAVVILDNADFVIIQTQGRNGEYIPIEMVTKGGDKE